LDEETTILIDGHTEGCLNCSAKLGEILTDPKYHITPEQEDKFIELLRVARLKDEEVEGVVEFVQELFNKFKAV
jgi:hypothetical protein